MRIAIIDDGISEEYVDTKIEHYCVIDGKVKKSDTKDLASLSHAWHCAKIIEKYYKGSEDLTLIDLRILYEDDQGKPEDLITALEFCSKMKIKLINLSCGFDAGSKEQELNFICKKLYDDGAVMIAANNNSCLLTYPACLPTVVSVEEEIAVPELAPLWYVAVDVSAHGEHQLMFGEKEIYSMSSNSYSCAYVTAIAVNQLAETGAFELKNLDKTVRVYPYCKIYDFAQLPDVVLISDEDDSKDVSFQYTKFPDTSYPEKLNLVVIPSKKVTKRTAKEALNKLSGRVLSLFWCGKKIPLTLKWTCERSKVRYWDETIDRSGLFETAPDIPMVQFSGNSNIVKTTMLSLKSLLINDDYNPLLISDRERAYLYGFKKLYQKTDILVYAHHFIPDIILIDSKEKVNDEEEITVECSSDGFKITNDTVAESADDIEQLYYTIKSIYSG